MIIKLLNGVEIEVETTQEKIDYKKLVEMWNQYLQVVPLNRFQ